MTTPGVAALILHAGLASGDVRMQGDHHRRELGAESKYILDKPGFLQLGCMTPQRLIGSLIFSFSWSLDEISLCCPLSSPERCRDGIQEFPCLWYD